MQRNAMRSATIRQRAWTAGVGLMLTFALGACASRKTQAPVEDRVVGTRPTAAVPAATPPAPPAAAPMAPPGVAMAAADPAKLPLGIENLGKPGYYQVKPGDTMIRIGLENGQNWKDLVKWNNLENPNLIEVGQVLRVVAPGTETGAASRPVGTARVESRPLDAKPTVAASSAVAATPAPPAAPTPPNPGVAAPAVRDADDDVTWQWPAAGPVASAFDEGRTKGLAIAGKLGDPVLAAADGRVVYAGSGLRGYGNLVILKHNNTWLTAYAHNQSLLVKEDQSVRRGQKIAEMGSSDAERVQLHFEIRKQGKPVDPAKLLPPR
jgi:lipoprotein NlpD